MVDHNQTNQSPKCMDFKTTRSDRSSLCKEKRYKLGCHIYRHTSLGILLFHVASHYLTQNAAIPRKIAGILLSGILSDTLNLQSPTTTDYDRKILVAHIAEVNGREDINKLANEQFNAKSNALLEMTCFEIYHGDAALSFVTTRSVVLCTGERAIQARCTWTRCWKERRNFSTRCVHSKRESSVLCVPLACGYRELEDRGHCDEASRLPRIRPLRKKKWKTMRMC